MKRQKTKRVSSVTKARRNAKRAARKAALVSPSTCQQDKWRLEYRAAGRPTALRKTLKMVETSESRHTVSDLG